ncbi:YkvA family protein [Segnochrobactrum spirostomi]|nr:YkvA family protein [Segnochrobactrum spirostomi]
MRWRRRAAEAADETMIEPEIAVRDEARNARRVRARFWRTVKRAAGQVPFLDEVVAAYYCAFDPATPNRVRAMLLAALAYFVLPIDVVPDLLAGIGFTDDIAVLTAVFGLLRGHIRDEHRAAARAALAVEPEDEPAPEPEPAKA